MQELRCLNCSELFNRERGHLCLSNRFVLRTEDVNKILADIGDELDIDEHEFISSVSEELPELSSVCTEIFNRISNPYTDSNASKEETFEADQHNRSRSVSFSEKFDINVEHLVSDLHAVPGRSRLPLNERKGSLFQEVFEPKPYQALPTNVKRWTCNVCLKVFKLKDSFRRHMRFHGREKKHKCDFCGKSFHQKIHLQTHVRTHTGEKPFSCDVCGIEFRKNDHLKMHILTHEEEKPYKCDICLKTFKLKTYLKKHTFSHSDKNPFTCSICGRVYKWKKDLSRHMNIHTGQIFLCDICGISFTQKHYLKKHACKHTYDKL